MIKINLLGKKEKTGAAPFGLDARLAAMGVSGSDFAEMRPALIRLVVLVLGLYAADYIPTYYQQQKIKVLDDQLAVLTEESTKLNVEFASKRDIRKQMEQLNKEESELQRQLNAVNSLQRDRGLAFRTIDNLVLSMPPKVWLTSVQYAKQVTTIKGSCWEYFPINDFVKTINESTQYTSVNFKGIQTSTPTAPVEGVPVSAQKMKNFDLEFKVKGSGET